VKRFSKGEFSEDYQVTVGVNHTSQSVTIQNEEGPVEVKMIIWDLGGQDKFKFVRPMFYRSARAIVIMFDVTDKESFEAIPRWIKEAEDNIGYTVPIVLAANKTDLSNHHIEAPEIERYAEHIGADFVLTSVKNNDNVNNMFEKLGVAVYNARTDLSATTGNANAIMRALNS
jgi:small GTP-binding protein